MADCKCSRSSNRRDFDAEAAYHRLNKKYLDLADIVVRYMSEAGLKRSIRSTQALMMAERLTTVIGGSPTGDFPDCCFVQGSKGLCTGVLIHPRVILTARHCGTVQYVGLGASSVYDTSYEHGIALDGQSPPAGDLQVVILRDPATTQPTKIAQAPEFNGSSITTIVGFGESEVGLGEKRSLTIPIIPNSTNAEYDRNSEFVVGGGACRGDSGGPAYIEISGQRKVAGIHSRHTGSDCSDGGIYTRVDVHRNFIRGVAASYGINI